MYLKNLSIKAANTTKYKKEVNAVRSRSKIYSLQNFQPIPSHRKNISIFLVPGLLPYLSYI